ncbi:hypothetical protein N9Y42_01220 [Mariniblastus sp.]|nr:hypothetical protein [Mariniblastus sp.]
MILTRWWVGIRIKLTVNSGDTQCDTLARIRSYLCEFDPPYFILEERCRHGFWWELVGWVKQTAAGVGIL